MKDGRTHLAHKAEHAVDMDTGAILGVTLQGANLGDTTTVIETFAVSSFPAPDPSTQIPRIHEQYGQKLSFDVKVSLTPVRSLLWGWGGDEGLSLCPL